ncbi:hypothetical protein Moror_13434 [Moniliophthora roreri MCA 2997]|uniref:Uncharacterized protein n=1 Tax=Moniliophthora roreri (strain MCA 2997) TaxID=1381753 RepID=V2WNB7_MONRO|nr:hypothetical protein Moror_13434 [Moniliophthora roreri MCA 2997]
MPPPSASELQPLAIQAPRPSNPIWRASTPPRFRDATTVTPPPRYRSVLTAPSTPISNPSGLLLPPTEIPPNQSLANHQSTPIPPRTLIRDPTTRSVWDDEDLEEASSSEPSSSPTNSDDMTDEVFEYLCALCAEWRTTAAETARATVVRYAGRLRLVTSLEIVVSNDGREELLGTTLPSARRLLEMIFTGVTPTPSSTETESSNETTAATENVEENYEWVYTGRQESFREVTLSDGTVARLEFRP